MSLSEKLGTFPSTVEIKVDQAIRLWPRCPEQDPDGPEHDPARCTMNRWHRGPCAFLQDHIEGEGAKLRLFTIRVQKEVLPEDTTPPPRLPRQPGRDLVVDDGEPDAMLATHALGATRKLARTTVLQTRLLAFVSLVFAATLAWATVAERPFVAVILAAVWAAVLFWLGWTRRGLAEDIKAWRPYLPAPVRERLADDELAREQGRAELERRERERGEVASRQEESA